MASEKRKTENYGVNLLVNQNVKDALGPVVLPSTSPALQLIISKVEDENEKAVETATTTTCVNRYVGTYQVAHCKSSRDVYSSTKLLSLEPSPAQQVASRQLRMTCVADSFVESLRKYPTYPQDYTNSSELIEIILSATLSKRVNRSKKLHSLKHSKRNSRGPINHPIHKNVARVKRLTATERDSHGEDRADPKAAPAGPVKTCVASPSITAGLKDISPRVQRMGRGAEVRYINDVRKCIRDAIRHVWNEDDNTVCPEIQRRFAQHQKEYHRPNRNVACGTSRVNSENQSPTTSKQSKATYQQQGLCCVCNKKLPCPCQAKAREEPQTITDRSFGRCLKFTEGYTSQNALSSTMSCCQFCKEEQDVFGDTLEQVNKWLQEIPVTANFSCDDNAKRQVIKKKLALALVKCKGVKDKQRVEIRKCLELLPMWQPADVRGQDVFKNNLIENLLNRLKLSYEENKTCDLAKSQEACNKNEDKPETYENDTALNKNMVLDTKIKDDIKKIIDITKNNCLDSRTESLLMEALIVKLKILSKSTHPKLEAAQDKINNCDEKQSVQENLAKKVSQVLEELPLGIGQNMKKVLKDEIIDVIFKKLDTGQKPDNEGFVEKSAKEVHDDAGSVTTVSLMDSSIQLKEDVQKYIKEYIGRLFRERELDVRNQSRIQNHLTNIMADQIMRGGNENEFREKAYSLLRGLHNISETQMEDLCNTILRDTNEMTFSFKNKTLPMFKDNTSKVKRNSFKNIEKEIIKYISDFASYFDSKRKEEVLASSRHLAGKIENIVSNVKRPNKEKEEMINKAIYSFMKNKGLPTDGRYKKFAASLTKRVLNVPLKSSTMQEVGDDFYVQSPTLSSIRCDDSINHLEQASLVQIYENVSLNDISREVLKCIENIPMERVVSRDKKYHKAIAKEIAKRLRNTTGRSSSPDSNLERTVSQWLPKLIKEPNKTDFSRMTSDLRRITKEKVSPASNDADKLIVTLKTGIMDWLKTTPLYQRRNSEEKQFQENLVMKLASELNHVINSVRSDQKFIDEELVLKTIKKQIIQFPMDPKAKFNEKYHHDIAVELLDHLKATEAILDVISSSLHDITHELEKLTERIPSHHLITDDRNYMKTMALEIAKRIKEETKNSSSPHLVLEREVQQWLSKIVKKPEASEIRVLTEDVIEVIKQKPLFVALPRSYTEQFNRNLRDGVVGWLKNTDMYQRRNKNEKLFIENLMADLAADLGHMLKNLPPNQKDTQKLLLNSIEARIKQLTLDSNMKYNEEHHRLMALELLNHLNDLQLLQKFSYKNDESQKTIYNWTKNLPLKQEIDAEHLAEFTDNIQSIFSEFANGASDESEKLLKRRLIVELKHLPLKDDFNREDKLVKLVDSLVEKVKDRKGRIDCTLGSRNVDDNVRHSVQKELASRFERLSIDAGKKPEDMTKIQQLKENLVSGLVAIINKLNVNPDILKDDTMYENVVKNEIEQLLTKIPINEYIRRYSAPLKKDLVNITKEVSKLERIDSAEKNYRKLLRDTLDRSLPITQNMSLERLRSFENMKDNLIEAFISLIKNTKSDTAKYKENIKGEINKFCNDYLRRYPAAPIDAKELGDNLYTALQSVPTPEYNSLNSDTEQIKVKGEIDNYMAKLPLQNIETNNILREQFVDFLLEIRRGLKAQEDDLENSEKEIMKKLNGFLFETDINVKQVTKDLLSIIKKSHRTTKGQITLPSEELTQPIQNAPQGLPQHLDEPLHECVPTCIPCCSNIGNQTVLIPDCQISIRNKIDCDALLCPNRRCCHTKENESLRHHRPGDFISCPNRKALPKRKKTQGAQTPNVCDIPPRVIVKEYYWGTHGPCQLNDPHQDPRGAQFETRRTVPSLPLGQTAVPCTSAELPTGLCRSARRLCIHSPCRSHVSMVDPHYRTFSIPVEHQPMEEELWATGKLCPNTRYRQRQSNVNLTRNADGTDGFVTRTTSESITQRRRFCNRPCATCSNAGIQELTGCNNGCRYATDADGSDSGMRSRANEHRPPGQEAAPALADGAEEKVECRCYGLVHDSVYAHSTPDAGRMASRQCPGAGSPCVNCHEGLCLRPSYIYFS